MRLTLVLGLPTVAGWCRLPSRHDPHADEYPQVPDYLRRGHALRHRTLHCAAAACGVWDLTNRACAGMVPARSRNLSARNVRVGSRAAVVSRLMVGPVCAQL